MSNFVTLFCQILGKSQPPDVVSFISAESHILILFLSSKFSDNFMSIVNSLEPDNVVVGFCFSDLYAMTHELPD